NDRHGRPLAQAPRHFKAVKIREPQVENDNLRLARRGLHQALLRCRGFEELVAVGRERGPQEAPNLGFVFDDQYRGMVICHSLPAVRCTCLYQCSLVTGGGALAVSSSVTTAGGVPVRGSVKRKAVPPPERFSAQICPPWASMIPRQIVNPSPA